MVANFLKNVSFEIFKQYRRHPFKYVVNNYKFSSTASTKLTTGELIEKWNRVFLENNILKPKESIERIVAHTLGAKKITDINNYANKYLSIEEENKIEEFCKKRLKNVPIQYIINEWNFRNLTLKMRPPVFVPWAETEQLIDVVLNDIPKDSTSTILELCCGSGAICLSILNERPHIKAIAIDKSCEACTLTLENATIYNMQSRLTVKEMNLNSFDFNAFNTNKFDVIVSNPPYMLSEEMSTLEPEILLYQDQQALQGGIDGLNLTKIVLNLSSKLLNSKGKLFLEINPKHAERLKSWIKNNPGLGLNLTQIYKDYCNENRFAKIEKN